MTLTLKKGLYAITDCENFATEEMLRISEEILGAGICALQYRDKCSNDSVRYDRADALLKLCRKYNIPFIINDDIVLVRDIKADGVHLGEDDPDYNQTRELLGEQSIIGLSCYNDLQLAKSAQQMGADYLALGAFFPTQSKSATVKADIDLLIEVKRHTTIPVAAIGGITPENGDELIRAGADMLAVISGIYQADNPAEAVRRYNRLFNI